MSSPLELALSTLRDELLRQIDIACRHFVNFTVIDDSPLTVTLAGGTVEVAALGLDGATYAPGDTGIAIVIEGTPPVLLKTV